jgi:hypothetical protein
VVRSQWWVRVAVATARGEEVQTLSRGVMRDAHALPATNESSSRQRAAESEGGQQRGVSVCGPRTLAAQHNEMVFSSDRGLDRSNNAGPRTLAAQGRLDEVPLVAVAEVRVTRPHALRQHVAAWLSVRGRVKGRGQGEGVHIEGE